MIAQRIFAILAAVMLVGAVALATLGPPEVPLAQVLFMINHDLMAALQGGVEKHLWAWIWNYLMQPLMVRPAWLVPACIGLVCAGMSLTLSSRKTTRRSHRRS